MNSFQQNKRSRRTLLLLTLIVFIIAGVDYASAGFVRTSIRDAVSMVQGGVFKMVSAVSAAKPLSSRQSLLDENARLKEEMRTLSSYATQNEILKAENNALRSLVRLQEDTSLGISARIVSSLRSSPFSTLVIGIGEGAGISIGDYAVIQGGFAIGTVSEVGERSSLVTLFTAPEQTVAVQIGEAPVEMKGRGAGNAVAELPREIVISEGDAVLLQGSRFAAGVVGRIESTPANASKRVFVVVPVSIQSERFVTVFPGAL